MASIVSRRSWPRSSSACLTLSSAFRSSSSPSTLFFSYNQLSLSHSNTYLTHFPSTNTITTAKMVRSQAPIRVDLNLHHHPKPINLSTQFPPRHLISSPPLAISQTNKPSPSASPLPPPTPTQQRTQQPDKPTHPRAPPPHPDSPTPSGTKSPSLPAQQRPQPTTNLSARRRPRHTRSRHGCSRGAQPRTR